MQLLSIPNSSDFLALGKWDYDGNGLYFGVRVCDERILLKLQRLCLDSISLFIIITIVKKE
jgi:hypothetical protein